MTREQIEKYKQELYEINKVGNPKEQWMQLVALAEKLNAPIPEHNPEFLLGPINKITRNIHTVLQTEEMFNACVSAEQSCGLAKQSCELAKQSSTTAKWACIWAAVAAIASAIGSVAALMALFIE
jgi:hypothetical protein